MKNEEQLILTSLIDAKFVTTLIKNRKSIDPEVYMPSLNKFQIKKIKSFVNNYFDLILNNSANSFSRTIIKEWRKTLENKLFLDINREICLDPTMNSVKKAKSKIDSENLINLAIDSAIYKLFFYSDLTFGALIGNIEYFNIHINKASKFIHSISNKNKNLYLEVWELIEKFKKVGLTRNKNIACKRIAQRHPENSEDYENPQRLYKRFSKFMRENKIYSLFEYKNYLSTDRK